MLMIIYNFLDIDECSLSIDECHENANCINIPGSYLCKCEGRFARNKNLCQGKKYYIVMFYVGHSAKASNFLERKDILNHLFLVLYTATETILKKLIMLKIIYIFLV